MCQDGKNNSSWAMFKAIYWDRTRYQIFKIQVQQSRNRLWLDTKVRMNDGSKYSASTNIHLKCLEMSASVFSRWVDESTVFIISMSLDTMVLTSLSKNVVYIGIPYIPKPRCFPPVEKKGQEIGVASVLNSLLDQFVSVICTIAF